MRSAKATCLMVASVGLGIGVAGLIFGVASSDNRPLLGWLMGTAYWLAPMVGLLMFTMLLYVFDAGWSAVIRRQVEHLLSGFKWVALALLALVALVWLTDQPGLLWKWLDPANPVPGGHGTVASDPLYVSKSGYLNKEFFTARSVLFIAAWVLLVAFFRRQSFRTDVDGDPRRYGFSRRWAAGGIVISALALTFGAIDWFKSLEYHWFSTMYGVWFFAAAMYSGVALTIVTMYLAERSGALKGLITKSQYYLMGCLLLAFTVFWAYISFSQYIIIFAANIPEETFWYTLREIGTSGRINSWGWLSIIGLIVGHFLLPFLLLVFFNNKVHSWRLFAIAIICLVFHTADIYWNILPGKVVGADGTYTYREFGVAIWEVATFVGLGGLIAASYLHSAARYPVLPSRDPRVDEALNYHI